VGDCAVLLVQANTERPTSALMSVQLASMSCIIVLFGAFFVAQSAARLIKEYQNGQLGDKWRALVVGGSSTAKDSAAAGGSLRDRRVAGSEMPTQLVSRAETMAAYQQE